MRYVPKHEDVFRGVFVIGQKPAPSFADQSAYPSHFHSLEDHLRKFVWVVHHNAAKADIHRWFPGVQEIEQVLRGFETLGQVQEDKSR